MDERGTAAVQLFCLEMNLNEEQKQMLVKQLAMASEALTTLANCINALQTVFQPKQSDEVNRSSDPMCGIVCKE
jgi:hypothetical protein